MGNVFFLILNNWTQGRFVFLVANFHHFLKENLLWKNKYFVRIYRFLICQKLSQYERVLKIFQFDILNITIFGLFMDDHHTWTMSQNWKIMILMKLTLIEPHQNQFTFNFYFIFGGEFWQWWKKIFFFS